MRVIVIVIMFTDKSREITWKTQCRQGSEELGSFYCTSNTFPQSDRFVDSNQS